MVGIVAISAFVLTAAGVWMLLQQRLLRVALGVTLISHAVNLILLSAGSLGTRPPLVVPGAVVAELTDPVPQAFVLTAIVISMALTLYLLAGLATRALRGESTDLDAAPESDEGLTPDEIRAQLGGGGQGA
ncbi:MAG: NADH-quinone oxidoreductase subunit K [Deltaproteobacteria bacterium]|nr:NADH-quinone oxidoreductase subunit K [Deltaproteobacteria bacterium]